MARAQASGLRSRSSRAGARQSQFLLHRRLRAFGATDPGALVRELSRVASARVSTARGGAPRESAGIRPRIGHGGRGRAALRARTRPQARDARRDPDRERHLDGVPARGARPQRTGRLALHRPSLRGGELQPLVAGTSIDLYDASPLPPGKEPGWAIPDDLLARWELRLGDAREVLPALLVETGEIDLFFHDSLHTREHMLFEFETAWPALARGGLLASDDVFQRKHDALPAFARSVGRPFTTFGNLGFVRK